MDCSLVYKNYEWFSQILLIDKLSPCGEWWNNSSCENELDTIDLRGFSMSRTKNGRLNIGQPSRIQDHFLDQQ